MFYQVQSAHSVRGSGDIEALEILAYTFVDMGTTGILFAGATNFNTRPLEDVALVDEVRGRREGLLAIALAHESPSPKGDGGKIPRLLDPAPNDAIL